MLARVGCRQGDFGCSPSKVAPVRGDRHPDPDADRSRIPDHRQPRSNPSRGVAALQLAAALEDHHAADFRERGEGRVAATVLAAGSVFAAIQLVLSTLFAMLAYSIAGSADAGATKALFDFDLGLDLVAGLAAGLFVLASSVGLRRTKSIPAWLAWAGVVVAAVEFIRVTTWARDGFWSPAGEYVFVAVVCGFLRILMTSVVLVSRQRSENAVLTATASPSPS